MPCERSHMLPLTSRFKRSIVAWKLLGNSRIVMHSPSREKQERKFLESYAKVRSINTTRQLILVCEFLCFSIICLRFSKRLDYSCGETRPIGPRETTQTRKWQRLGMKSISRFYMETHNQVLCALLTTRNVFLSIACESRECLKTVEIVESWIWKYCLNVRSC